MVWAFGEHVYAVLLDAYLGVELLSHSVCVCSALVDVDVASFPK